MMIVARLPDADADAVTAAIRAAWQLQQRGERS